jgi:hypothetical protein
MPTLRKLIHEVWEDQAEDGQCLPGICLAGPRGADFRASQSKNARLIGRIEAATYFEAMTEYHRLLAREPYTTDHEWDRQPYPVEWFAEQASTR